jgi:uncharacterized protein (TIGR03437 family)
MSASRKFIALAFLLALPLVAMVQDKDDDPAARLKWFQEQRVDSQGMLAGYLRLAAIKKLESMLRAQSSQKPGAAAVAGQWTSIGPTAVNGGNGVAWSGRVTALAVDQHNANVVFLGAADGGVWKTTDGGNTWTALTDSQPSMAVGSIAIDPQNSSVVYVGTGEANNCSPCYYGAGLLKSTDGGATWTNIMAPFADSTGRAGKIASIAVSPVNSQLLLAAVNATLPAYQGGNLSIPSGIYRSTDAGATWSVVAGAGHPGSHVLFNPVNPTQAFATVSGAYGTQAPSTALGVFVSNDSGVTWTASNGAGSNVIPLAGAGRIDLALAPSSPQVLFAAVSNANATAGNLLGLYKSTDGGANWSQLTNTPDYCVNQCWYDNVLAVDPTNPSIVFAGGIYNLWRSMDGGQNWSSITNGSNGQTLHVDHHALAFAAGATRLYDGNDGGVWSTSTPEAASIAWTNLNSTLTITQFYPSLSINPGNLNIAFGGAQDNGTETYSGNLAWQYTTCGDGGWTAIDPSQTSTIYASCQNIMIEKSTTGGAGWSLVSNEISQNDRSAFIPPLVMDPSNPLRLYFGTYRLWQTSDGAGGWAAVSDDLTAGGDVRAIAVAPSDPQTVYSGSSDGEVWVTRLVDARDFSTYVNRSAGLPGRFVTQICVDPTAATTAYVAYSGFTGLAPGDTQGHVFRTLDGGATWLDISGNLPNVPVNDMVLDPDLPGTIYVATDVGVFVTGNTGVSWTVLGAGLPRVVVIGMRLHRATRTLRVATHGRGMWDIVAPLVVGANPAPGLSAALPASATPGSGDLAVVISGAGFVPGSSALWNGQARPTTVTSSSQITVTIAASDLANASLSQLSVRNPAPGGGVSNALSFAVVAQPAINTAGIVNAATYSAAPLAAGSLASIFGTNLAAASGTAPFLPLPLVLNGVTVQVDGIAEPLIFVSSAQINFQVPWEDAGLPAVSVTVAVAGNASVASTLQLATANPAIFATNQEGTGQGAILIANSALLAAPAGASSRPAAKDESVSIFCTGLGGVMIAQVSGQPAPSGLVPTRVMPTVTIGGKSAVVSFSGLAPGFVGLYQVNVAVPPAALLGDAIPLVLTINGFRSNTVTLAVQ